MTAPAPAPTTTSTAPAPAPALTPSPASVVPPRLRNGELRQQVAQYLTDRPGQEFTPSTIARDIQRSAGAVGNALAVLVTRGEADRTTTKPQRFAANTATAAAAAVILAAWTSTPRAPRLPRAKATTTPGTPAPTTSPTAPAAPTPATMPAAPSAPAVVTSATVVSGPIARPDGKHYHPRTLAGMPDVTALRKLREAGIFVLLYGPPGTGKTSVVEAAFPDVLAIAGDGETTVDHVVGQYIQNEDGRYEWVEGPLVTAMREGRPLFIDDATLIPPPVLAVVYPVMDGHTKLVVKGHKGETVIAAPGFYVIGGHNPNVHGAVLTDALASRFAVQIEVSSDYDLAEQLGINRSAIRVARNLSARHASGEIGWAPQLRQLVQFAKTAAALGDEAAAANMISIAPEDDREIVASVVRQTFGKDIAPLALGPRI